MTNVTLNIRGYKVVVAVRGDLPDHIVTINGSTRSGLCNDELDDIWYDVCDEFGICDLLEGV